jgi:hypothetical protein
VYTAAHVVLAHILTKKADGTIATVSMVICSLLRTTCGIGRTKIILTVDIGNSTQTLV